VVIKVEIVDKVEKCPNKKNEKLIEGQLLSTMIAHDVSLSVLNATMHPELHLQLVHAQKQWDEHPCNSDSNSN